MGRGQEILPIGGHLSRDLKEVGTEAMGTSSQRAAVRRLGEDAVRGGARADWHRVRATCRCPVTVAISSSGSKTALQGFSLEGAGPG